MSQKKKILLTITAIVAIITIAIVAIKILGIKASSPEEGTNGEVVQNTEPVETSETEPTREIQTQATQTQTRGVSTTDTSKWDFNRVNAIEDTAGISVPVPKGYVASSVDGEHTVNTGFVIYEGEDAVTDENKDTAQKTRDQWVWVPVENMSDIYFTDSKGKKHGQLWSFSSTGRTKKSYSSTGYREPDILTGYDKSSTLPRNISEEDQTNLNEEMEQEFEYTINSIEKYGGFYIGRYETGNLSKPKVKVVKGNSDFTGQSWYAMYRKCKQIMPNGNKNVKTSMIWGSLWDHTLNWFVTSGNKKYSDISNSTSWGNYLNSTFQYQNTNEEIETKNTDSTIKIPTGSSEYTKANNVYDMAGNVFNWTLEVDSTNNRVSRGGYYLHNGNRYSASYRTFNYYPNSYNFYKRVSCYALYKIVIHYIE